MAEESDIEHHNKLLNFIKEDYSDSSFNENYANTAPELSIDTNKSESLYGSFGFGPMIEVIESSIVPIEGKKILEVGGSSGLLASKLQEMGAIPTILETQQPFVDKAKSIGLDARIYDGFNPHSAILGEKFDVIVANRVFEDIVMSEHQALFLMRKLSSFLNPGGLIIIGTQQPTAVFEEAITKGIDAKLIESRQFSSDGYIRQVNVYQTQKS